MSDILYTQTDTINVSAIPPQPIAVESKEIPTSLIPGQTVPPIRITLRHLGDIEVPICVRFVGIGLTTGKVIFDITTFRTFLSPNTIKTISSGAIPNPMPSEDVEVTTAVIQLETAAVLPPPGPMPVLI